MRRKIALLMIMIMTINLFQGVTFAAEGRNNKIIHLSGQGIQYNEDQKELVVSNTRDEDEVALSIPLGEISTTQGGSILSYYMEEDGQTQKVEIELLRKALEGEVELNYIDVIIRVYEHNGTEYIVKELNYAQLESPYEAVVVGEAATELRTQIKLNPSIEEKEKKEAVITIEDGGITRLEFFYDDETRLLNFATSNIKQGYQTPFMWQTLGAEPVNQFTIFSGVEDMQIEPTHLMATTQTALGFYSKDVINLSHESIMPGSKPGIVVSFNIPNVLEGGQFKPMNEVEMAGTLEAALTLDIRGDNQPEFQIHTFMLNDPDETIIEQGGKYKIYVSKDSEAFERVHEEERLGAGEVITAQISVRQKDAAGEIIPNTASSNQVVGATYTEIEMSRITETDIQFNVQPFNYETNQIMYQLYRKGSSFAGDLDFVEQQDLDDTQTAAIMEDIRQIIVESASRKPEDRTDVGLQDLERNQEIYVINAHTTEGESIKMYTQAIMYEADDNVLPLRTVKIESYNNTYVLEGTHELPQIAVTDMTLSIPNYYELIEKLETGNIFYELHLDMKTEEGSELAPILVLKVQLQNGEPTLEVYQGLGPLPEQNSFTIEHQPNGSGLVTIEGIILKAKGNSTPWQTLDIPDMVDNKYPEASAIEKVESQGVTVPGIVQTQIKTIFEPYDGTNSLINTTESNFKPLTLSVTKEIVPIPYFKDFVEQEINETDAIIKFERVDLSKYFNSMIRPLEQEIDRSYELYLSKAAEDLNIEQGKTNQIVIDKIPSSTDESPYTHIIDLLDEIAEDGRSYAEKLSAGETIAIILTGDNLDPVTTNDAGIRVKIEGLDYNTPYYSQLRLKVDNLDTEEVAFSSLSRILSFTTGTEATPPRPEDRRPPVPDNYMQYEVEGEDTDEASITLTWEKPDIEDVVGTEGDEEYIYFEMVRTTNSEQAIMDNVDLERFEGQGLKLFRTNSADQIIKQYTDSTGWTNLGEQVTFVHTEEPFVGKFVLTEEEPLPNTIYYYYIRTVRVMQEGNQEIKAYSEWIMTPVTTSPVKPPVDLRVEHDERYDAESEVVVSFLASIPEEIVAPAEPGEHGFRFDFNIFGEDVSDIEDVAFEFLRKVDENDAQTRVYYKITGLKHATRYDIKVRILDYTLSLENPSGSLYSNQIRIRTNYSEEEQNKEDAYDEYLEIYDRETEKLKVQSYWTAQSDEEKIIYKYREDYLSNELAITDMYELMSQEGIEEVVYYLPKEILDIADKENTIMNAVFSDYELYIRPGVLDGSDEIEEAQDDIENNDLEDYYIEISLSSYDKTSTINRQKTVLPIIHVEMQVIRLYEEDRWIEEQIKTVLIEEIAYGREDLIEYLERELEDGKIEPEELEERTLEEIAEVKEKHAEEVEELIEDEIEDEEPIDEIQQSMLLIADTEEDNVQGYYKDGSKWTSVYTNMGFKGYTMTVEALGQYTVVAGNPQQQSVLAQIPGANDLYNKYHLGDFISPTEAGLNQPINKETLYGSVARLLGATRDTDYVNYLKNRGINLEASYNLNSYARQDEVIYVVMQAYEKMYYKNVNNIQINNKQAIQNIGAFQAKYRPYVYASVELGVVKTVNNKVLPSENMTGKVFLNMLTKIMPR